MLTMARVLVGDPSLLLADEPSEGLAAMTVAYIHSILGELKQAGAIASSEPRDRTCAGRPQLHAMRS
jgi:ABC-type branched-subunit amino acid transport system ATPase component